MSKTLYFSVFFILIWKALIAQGIVQGLYINASTKDLMCITDDSLTLRVVRGGGVILYTVFYGHYHQNRNVLEFDRNLAETRTSIIEESNIPDSILQFQVIDCNGRPMPFVHLSLYSSNEDDSLEPYENDKYKLLKLTDKDGYVSFDRNDFTKLIGTTQVVRISSVGFETKHVIDLSLGKSIKIYSIVPRGLPVALLTVRNTKVPIIISQDSVILDWGDGQSTILKRIDNCDSCFDKILR